MVEVAVLQQAKNLLPAGKALHGNQLQHLPNLELELMTPIINEGYHELQMRLELMAIRPQQW